MSKRRRGPSLGPLPIPPEAGSAALAPVPEPVLYGDPSEVVDALAAVVSRISQLEADRDELVRLARSQGVTWSRLGEVLGVTHQAVAKRFGGGRL